MNLALRGIEADLGDRSADSFSQDLHPTLRADFVLANPPFNVSNWWDPKLADDPRWAYGTPPESNANFAWVQLIAHHLAPRGRAGFVLANMSLTSDDGAEKAIREGLLRDNLIDCIVTLPDKLFTNTPISVSLWLLDRDRERRGLDEVLFVDASAAATAVSRTRNTLDDTVIEQIAAVYHAWREGEGVLPGERGVRSVAVTMKDVNDKNCVLLPAAYLNHADPTGTGVSTVRQATRSVDLLESLAALKDLVTHEPEVKRQLLELESALFTMEIAGEWVPIGDLVKQSKETLGTGAEPEVLTCTESAGLLLQRERFSKRVATTDVSKYKVVRKTDIVYNPYLLWKGSIDQCWIVDRGITSPAYEVFRVAEGCDPVVIGEMLTTPEMIRRYAGISFGTVERRRRAAPANFLGLEVFYPLTQPQVEFSSLVAQLRVVQSIARSLERGLDQAVTQLCSGLLAEARSVNGV